jgi:uncharacterized damage-inducible protein DinB
VAIHARFVHSAADTTRDQADYTSRVTEAWLRGPVSGIEPVVMPAVHALMHAQEEIARIAPALGDDELWATPGGAASIGFHLRHITGSIDRMLTYAADGALDRRQLATLGDEARPEGTATQLAVQADQAIERAIAQIRDTPATALHDARTVGRAALPTTVFGLLFHIGEHTARHAGQIVTLAKVVRR